ncbi:MAG TPA: type II secretion system major pseudopilin GspG [Planctomycetota bacterium]
MNIRNSKRPTRRSGFTLIEVLVVVLIIGLLVGLVGPNVYNALIRGQKGTARAQIKSIVGNIELYRLSNQKLPDSLDDLTEPDPETGQAYMKTLPPDPWGFDYILEVSNDGSYEVLSYGADNAPGGDGDDADISSNDT